jgi:2-keto-4-pentenoate hydratase/2-oxohepta-3-ene-1,7-dioic acid hydratase in catechol pathway
MAGRRWWRRLPGPLQQEQGMKWLRFVHQGAEGFGSVEGTAVRRHTGELFNAPLPTDELIPLDAIVWLPPCRPGKLIGLWNNFRAAALKNGWAEPAEPLYFLKSPDCVAGHRQAIAVPASYSGRVAYEGELAVVIGRTARAVAVADAAAHIFGYACANDVTALELLHRDASFPQWTRAKSVDGFGAFGPVIDTGFDPAAEGAALRTVVAGRERQHYLLADMFFSPAQIVSALSQDMVLMPGDVILCGTSLGVLPMKPGSAVEVVIDGIGTLVNAYG